MTNEALGVHKTSTDVASADEQGLRSWQDLSSAEPAIASEPVVSRKHPGRYVGGFVVAVLAIAIIGSFFTNPNYEWDIVSHYLFDSRILGGLKTTIVLTIVCMLIAALLGLVLAVARLSKSSLLYGSAGVYIWFFRGTPVLVQLIIWYNLAILLPKVELGIPGVWVFAVYNTNDLITPWTAAILGLSLNEAAYISEIIRSGIISVDQGQAEAASALGLSKAESFFRIVLPQAMRIIIPPSFNEAVGLLKYSSVVSVIALPELLYSGQLIYGRTYETIPVLIVVCIWYLVVTSVLTVLESKLERRLGAGFDVVSSGKVTRRMTWMKIKFSR